MRHVPRWMQPTAAVSVVRLCAVHFCSVCVLAARLAAARMLRLTLRLAAHPSLAESSTRCRASVLQLHRRRCSGGCRRRRGRRPAGRGDCWHRRCRRRLGLDSNRRLRLDARGGRNEAWRQRALPLNGVRWPALVLLRRRSSRRLRVDDGRRLRLGVAGRRCPSGPVVRRRGGRSLDAMWRAALVRRWRSSARLRRCGSGRLGLDVQRSRSTLARRLRRRRCCGATLRSWPSHDGAGGASSASRLLGSGVPRQSAVVMLTPHGLHLVRTRARKIYDATANIAHSVVVRACSFLRSAKAAQLGLHATKTAGCHKHSRRKSIRFETDSLKSVLHMQRVSDCKAAIKEPERAPHCPGSRRPAPTRPPRLAQRP
jgi:hypothetical protein